MKKYIFNYFLYSVYTLLIAPLIFMSLYQYLGQGKPIQVILVSHMRYLTTIILIIIGLMATQAIVRRYRIFFYYSIWINKIYSFLKKYSQYKRFNFVKNLSHFLLEKFFDDYFYSLVLRSFKTRSEIDAIFVDDGLLKRNISKHKTRLNEGNKSKPVFIRREHLMEKGYWPNWAFAIIILFNKIIIKRFMGENNRLKYRLSVDLCNQSYGIYNNIGKRFIAETFMDEDFKSRAIRESNTINEFICKKNTNTDNLTIDGKEMPFRWSSGGILPIAKWNNRLWYVLYFRDIEPVGWNIANGASESKEEYKNLNDLIYREFPEELVLLSREPNPGGRLPVSQKMFRFPAHLPISNEIKIISKEFAKKHCRLRKDQDEINLREGEIGPLLQTIETPFEVEVKYHDVNLTGIITNPIKNIIFNINPTEFGIEILRVAYFEMDTMDYLLDGEIWETEDSLVRRPIMLIACNYIEEIYKKNGSLGVHLESSPYLDCKQLNIIPKGEYKIFYKDIDLRKKRLKEMEKNKSSRKSLEAKRYKKWLNRYEKLFIDIKNIHSNIHNEQHSPLTTLCPVSWKAMEIINQYDLIKLNKSICD